MGPGDDVDALDRGRADPRRLGDRPGHRGRCRAAHRHAHRHERVRLPQRDRPGRVFQGHPCHRDPADRPGAVGCDAHDEVRARRIRRVLAAGDPGLLRRPVARPGGARHRDRAARPRSPQVRDGDHAERGAVHRDGPARRGRRRAHRGHHRRADRRRHRRRRAHPARGERRAGRLPHHVRVHRGRRRARGAAHGRVHGRRAVRAALARVPALRGGRAAERGTRGGGPCCPLICA